MWHYFLVIKRGWSFKDKDKEDNSCYVCCNGVIISGPHVEFKEAEKFAINNWKRFKEELDKKFEEIVLDVKS